MCGAFCTPCLRCSATSVYSKLTHQGQHWLGGGVWCVCMCVLQVSCCRVCSRAMRGAFCTPSWRCSAIGFITFSLTTVSSCSVSCISLHRSSRWLSTSCTSGMTTVSFFSHRRHHSFLGIENQDQELGLGSAVDLITYDGLSCLHYGSDDSIGCRNSVVATLIGY